MKKYQSTLTILLVLSIVLISLPQIYIVKAESTIYIRTDGSVEGTDKIQREGDLYTLTGDISGEIKVEKSFIVIDGAGYTLQGNGEGTGIDISTLTPSETLKNVTIKNIQIKNFESGIYSLNNNTFIGNYIADCFTGINIIGGSNNIIKNNTLANNVNAISIAYSGDNHVITENNMINDAVSSNNVIIVWLSPQPTVDGNYWSDYTGTDSNGDGIGDESYIYINTDYAKYVDNHPLMQPVPVIPEFKPWTIISLFLVSTLFLLFNKKRIHSLVVSKSE